MATLWQHCGNIIFPGYDHKFKLGFTLATALATTPNADMSDAKYWGPSRENKQRTQFTPCKGNFPLSGIFCAER